MGGCGARWGIGLSLGNELVSGTVGRSPVGNDGVDVRGGRCLA